MRAPAAMARGVGLGHASSLSSVAKAVASASPSSRCGGEGAARHHASATSGERLWRLPLEESYEKHINSDVADMKNIGGRPGGSITAAQFLQRFVDGTPWAHSREVTFADGKKLFFGPPAGTGDGGAVPAVDVPNSK